MTPQVRIWVVADDVDPRGMAETEDAPFVPGPRRPAEREYLTEHIVLGTTELMIRGQRGQHGQRRPPPHPDGTMKIARDRRDVEEAVRMAMRLQLTSGLHVLEEWAIDAPQADRNVIYEALFAVADGSAFLIYDIFGDVRDPHQFIILVKHDLVMKIALNRGNSSFEIGYIGALEQGTPAAVWADGGDEP